MLYIHCFFCVNAALCIYITAMDKNAMSEVRSYQKPPRGVHNIMQATYLLLGEDEDTTMVSEQTHTKQVTLTFKVIRL